MATHRKNSLSKQVQALDTAALVKTAIKARKLANEHAVDARRYAAALGKQTDKRTRKARAEAELRREELMEKAAAAAGLAMSVAPVVIQTVMSNRKARRRAVVTAGATAARFHPVMLGATAIGVGFAGYKLWKRKQEADMEVDAFDEDPPRLQHARMDGEGPVPGGYESTPASLRVSRN